MFRIVNDGENWCVEKNKSQGVWAIIGEFRDKAEAEKMLEEVKNGTKTI